MKFYNNKRIKDCSIVDYITSKDWNITDSKDGADLVLSMLEYHIKHMSRHGTDILGSKQYKYGIDNFSKLKNFNKDQEVWMPNFISYQGITLSHNNSIAYIDRGKPKTIVVASGGSWILSLYRNKLEHQYQWMFEDFKDYNIISVVEDVSRTFTNPLLYDSCLYAGINNELNSIEKLADYIKELIPNTEYNVVADCKNGHSSCMLAYYLNATRVLIQSGTTTCNYNVFHNNISNDAGEFRIDDFFQSSLEMTFRNIAFCKNVPQHLTHINSIATHMPGTEFTYIHHADDSEFKHHIDGVDESIKNISKSSVNDTNYTHGQHYITTELRKSGMFTRYFS